MSMTSIWREYAADLREDANGLPDQRLLLIVAAEAIEEAAKQFDAKNDKIMRELYGS